MGATLALTKTVNTVGKVTPSMPTIEERVAELAREHGLSVDVVRTFTAIASQENASKVTAEAAFTAFGHLSPKSA